MDAAEKLFASKGVSSVSLREINSAAGVSQGVLHYHFKNRDGLITALLERRLPAITAERKRMVERLRRLPGAPTTRELLELIVLPLARVAIEQDAAGRRFIRVLGRLNSERNPVFQAVTGKYFKQLGLEVISYLAAQEPKVARELLELRLAMAMHVIYSTLAELGDFSYGWETELKADVFQPWQVVDALLDFLCGGVEGGSGG